MVRETEPQFLQQVEREAHSLLARWPCGREQLVDLLGNVMQLGKRATGHVELLEGCVRGHIACHANPAVWVGWRMPPPPRADDGALVYEPRHPHSKRFSLRACIGSGLPSCRHRCQVAASATRYSCSVPSVYSG